MVQEHRFHPRYVGGQVGPRERELKEKLAASFLNGGLIGRAYLARADLGGRNGHGVVLGLIAPGCDKAAVLREIEGIFASIFHRSQFLDTVFLSEHNEVEIRKVCEPFFERARETVIRIH
jgi:hypothetical protein